MVVGHVQWWHVQRDDAIWSDALNHAGVVLLNAASKDVRLDDDLSFQLPLHGPVFGAETEAAGPKDAGTGKECQEENDKLGDDGEEDVQANVLVGDRSVQVKSKENDKGDGQRENGKGEHKVHLHVENRPREVGTSFVCGEKAKKAEEEESGGTPHCDAQGRLQSKRVFAEAQVGYREAEYGEAEEDADDGEAANRLRRQILVVEGVLAVHL